MLTKKSVVGALATFAIAGASALTATAVAGPEHAHKHAAVGEMAPDFTLTDISGKQHTISDYTADGKVVVLEWFNPDCPYVVKHHEMYDTMATASSEFKAKGVVWLAVATGKTADKARLTEAAKEWSINYPILLDSDGSVGKMYAARTSPHMYIINKDGKLMYAGAIDDNSNRDTLGETNFVRQALQQVLAGETVTQAETKPYGCSVKY